MFDAHGTDIAMTCLQIASGVHHNQPHLILSAAREYWHFVTRNELPDELVGTAPSVPEAPANPDGSCCCCGR